ncbi:hypothetical protein [Halorhodospira halophila]|uniref:hypothetical protein n=1 Tax=Halorhodospira halophila TaxID=1053 RepID=UPI001912E010|nr:hypothetical protein [Halorhodospira halophila]MBK5942708.1 hypothetical protein [Halorhodospira halophila]
MKGIPSPALATRSDYERVHQMALDGELRPRDIDRLHRYWQALLDGRWRYDRDRVLGDGEEPDGEEPEYRVIEDEEEGRVQHIRVEDDRALIHRLGFSVDEVENKIKELS